MTSNLFYFRWNANPDYYDYLHRIEFNSDKIELSSGDSQSIRFICDVNFTHNFKIHKDKDIIETGSISLEYLDNHYMKIDKLNYIKPNVKYKIRKGLFFIDGDYTSENKQVFEYRLEFEETPFPYSDKNLIFYGFPLYKEDYDLKIEYEDYLKTLYKPLTDFKNKYNFQGEYDKNLAIFTKNFNSWKKYYDKYNFTYEV